MSKTDLEIDELNLDREWIRQPGLYYKYASKLADARTVMSNAKSLLEITEAEVATKVRRKPDKYISEDKVTVDAVRTAVTMHSDVRDATHKMIDSEHEVRVLEAMVSALEHKRSALTRLVELKQMDYFSEPSSKSSEHRERLREEVKKEAIRRTRKET